MRPVLKITVDYMPVLVPRGVRAEWPSPDILTECVSSITKLDGIHVSRDPSLSFTGRPLCAATRLRSPRPSLLALTTPHFLEHIHLPILGIQRLITISAQCKDSSCRLLYAPKAIPP